MIKAFVGVLVGVLILAMVLVNVDGSVLQDAEKYGFIADKWHTEECTPIFDGNSNYMGEVCDDAYVVALELDDKSYAEKRMKNLTF